MKKLVINNYVRKLRFLNDEITQKELALKVGVLRQTIVAIKKTSIGEIFYIDSLNKKKEK
jgi:DNA-binding XRE family transcriptional regulator